MSNSNAAPSFPYDHLGILGFQKLRRYVPPLAPAPSSANDDESDESRETGEDEPRVTSPVTSPGSPARP